MKEIREFIDYGNPVIMADDVYNCIKDEYYNKKVDLYILHLICTNLLILISHQMRLCQYLQSFLTL